MNGKKKAIICTNSAWTLFHFRGSLFKALMQQGFETVAVGPADRHAELFKEMGVRFVHVPMSQVGLNPFYDLYTIFCLYRIYRYERPDLVHHFSLKPILYGTIAARLARIRSVVNTVNGFGSSLGASGGAMRLLRMPILWALRWAMRPPVRVTFQNENSRGFYLENRLIEADRTSIILGSGVDPQKFKPEPNMPSCDGTRPIRFLMFSRMVREKGVAEYCDAAERIAKRFGNGKKATFTLIGGASRREIGSVDPEWLANPGTLDGEWLTAVAAKGFVNWLPHQEEMLKHIQTADVVVLPSYYPEGLPRSLLEAMACGKAIITTDTPGCRDVVVEGRNGLLVPPRDVAELEAAFCHMIENPNQVDRMGAESRGLLLERFSDDHVIDQTLAEYRRTDAFA